MRSRWVIAFWLMVALQVLGVLAFAAVKEATLRVGQEVVLETAPVDPRDLFRGDYVVLRYTVSEVPGCWQPVGSTIYVPLIQRGDVWVAGGASPDLASASHMGSPVLRGQVSRPGRGPGSCEVVYGLESYFVPQGKGRDIERVRGQLKVRVAVDGFGNAVIKELLLPTSA